MKAKTSKTDIGETQLMVLDDEKPIRVLVSKVLAKLGHTVFLAGNLQIARQLLQENSISLVLCDISLSNESGLEFLTELVPKSPDLAVVMMTGNSDTQTAIHCLRSGAFDYLLKPMISEDIENVVIRVLGRQRRMKAERERVEEQLQVLGRFSSENPNPVLRIGGQGRLLYANAASEMILASLGLTIGDRLPKRLHDLTVRARTQVREANFELENSGRSYSMTVTPIQGADYVYLYGHDISDLKRAERELIHLKDKAQKLALYDNLTGLANRALLDEQFGKELASSQRHGTKLVVAFIDLDRFKQINDTQGHKVGDQLLVSVARHLKESVRKTDTVARWGGDEFILLLPGIASLQDARCVCEKIKERVQKRIAAEDGFFVTMSLGAAICPDDSTDQQVLLQSADAALLMVKTRARNEVIVFGECNELRSFQEKNTIRSLLCNAVAEERIQVHYQPIIDSKSGLVVGAEALARWHEDGHGWISPGMFVPLAESMGIVEELGRIVHGKALRFLRNCHDRGFPISLSVNLSLRQLLRSDFVSELVNSTRDLELLPSQVTLELTESQALLGVQSESTHLRELTSAGFHLSIDDFGKGHSSLASLHEMPVEELKIDMKFIRNLDTRKGRRIVQTIEELARNLGLETVAEGVETDYQERTLQELGISRLQGFLYSQALSENAFIRFLEDRQISMTATRIVSDHNDVALPS